MIEPKTDAVKAYLYIAAALVLAIAALILGQIRHARADVGSQWDKIEIQRSLSPRPLKPASHTPPPRVDVVGGRPAGCPRAFCGCFLAIDIFGRADPSLFAAAAWYRFERAEPGSGRVAVRPHHVMKLLAHVSGDKWVIRDPNSGGGKVREHVRSIRGFTIVDPFRDSSRVARRARVASGSN